MSWSVAECCENGCKNDRIGVKFDGALEAQLASRLSNFRKMKQMETPLLWDFTLLVSKTTYRLTKGGIGFMANKIRFVGH